MERRESGRAEQLQFLRFVAFMRIYLWHADNWRPGFSARGTGAACAVAFFFVLSGLVTGYAHYGEDIAVTPRAVGRYMWRKIRRMYPLYLFTLVFALTYSKIPGYLAAGDYESLWPSLRLWLRDALMIQSWFPADYFSFNSAAWFVSTMLLLYLLTLPMLAAAARIRRSRRPAALYCCAVALLALAAVGYCYALRDTNLEYTQYVLPVARVWEYFLGICLGGLAQRLKPRASRIPPAVWTLMELATLAFWIVLPHMSVPVWQVRNVRWLLPETLLLLVFALGGGHVSRLFRSKPLAGLGDLMFEAFLLNTVIISVYTKCLSAQPARQMGNALRRAASPAPASPAGNAFNLLLCLALTLLLSWLIHGARREK